MSYKKIVLVGAGGSLGGPVLKELVDSGKFDITVLARNTSSYSAPAGVQLLKADFESRESLIQALKGQEALVLTQGDFATIFTVSKALIEAGIEAGVSRVIINHFGNDSTTPPGNSQQIFSIKNASIDYAKSVQDKISWTAISNGPFFDWGLTAKFIADIPGRKISLIDNGERKFNTTTLSSIGESIVGVLSNPSISENKMVRIHDFFVTQRQILDILEAEVGQSFEVTKIDSGELEAKAGAALGRGEFTEENFFGVLRSYIFGKNSSAAWGEVDDTVALGVKPKDLKTEIVKVLKTFA